MGSPKDALAVLLASWKEPPQSGWQERNRFQIQRQLQILEDLGQVKGAREALAPFLQDVARDADWRLARKATEALKKLGTEEAGGGKQGGGAP